MVAPAQKRYPGVSAQLFEYDERLKKYGSKFTFYDYNTPLDVPPEHHKAFQIVVADPPYLVRLQIMHRRRFSHQHVAITRLGFRVKAPALHVALSG